MRYPCRRNRCAASASPASPYCWRGLGIEEGSQVCGQVFAHAPERAPVDGAAAVGPDRLTVALGRIALVAAEPEHGVVHVVAGHEAVAGDLGHYRGGCDRDTQRVAVDYRF